MAEAAEKVEAERGRRALPRRRARSRTGSGNGEAGGGSSPGGGAARAGGVAAAGVGDRGGSERNFQSFPSFAECQGLSERTARAGGAGFR